MATLFAGGVRRLRWVGALLGLAAVVLAFFPWVRFFIPATPNNPEYDNWVAAFSAGYTGWVPVVLVLLAGVVALLQRTPKPVLSLLWLALCVAAAALTIYRWITVDAVSSDELDLSENRFDQLESITNAFSEPGLGLYLTLASSGVSAACAWLTFREARR